MLACSSFKQFGNLFHPQVISLPVICKFLLRFKLLVTATANLIDTGGLLESIICDRVFLGMCVHVVMIDEPEVPNERFARPTVVVPLLFVFVVVSNENELFRESFVASLTPEGK